MNKERILIDKKAIAIVGIVGIPSSYGGFETLAENLVRFREANIGNMKIVVYCSSSHYRQRRPSYKGANLKYIFLPANGIASIFYDGLSLISAVLLKIDRIVLLGISGAIFLPVIRLLSDVKIVTNIDGIEWKRQKWQGLARVFLKYSEKIAIKYSHKIISDNMAIKEYLQREYGANSHIIAYGGDHAINVSKENIDMYNLPANYSFTVCRIEPENNIHIILEAFARMQSEPLIMVGNWNDSEYGRKLRSKYKHTKHTYMLDPIYNLGQLATLRANAKYYIHGHSAGGTNPSLVEAMHFGRPIIAYDCVFNRYTTEEKATYFNSIDSLANILRNPDYKELNKNSREMRKIARKKYTWELVAKQYFELLNAV